MISVVLVLSRSSFIFCRGLQPPAGYESVSAIWSMPGSTAIGCSTLLLVLTPNNLTKWLLKAIFPI